MKKYQATILFTTIDHENATDDEVADMFMCELGKRVHSFPEAIMERSEYKPLLETGNIC